MEAMQVPRSVWPPLEQSLEQHRPKTLHDQNGNHHQEAKQVRRVKWKKRVVPGRSR